MTEQELSALETWHNLNAYEAFPAGPETSALIAKFDAYPRDVQRKAMDNTNWDRVDAIQDEIIAARNG